MKEENEREFKKQAKVDGPDYCIHCDEDPCVIAQIEARLCENDTINYDEREYENSPVTYNSGRRKCAYQYAAFVLWEGINYRRPHYVHVCRKRCSCSFPSPRQQNHGVREWLKPLINGGGDEDG